MKTERCQLLFPSGLATAEATQAFAKQLLDIKRNWQKYDTPKERSEFIIKIIDNLSKIAGIQKPAFDKLEMAETLQGYFVGERWTMYINSKVLEKPNLTPDEFIEVLKTIYHETRHAEQNYMSAQLLFGAKITQHDVSSKVEIKSDSIALAAKNPISPQSVKGIVANNFYQSYYGTSSAETRKIYLQMGLYREKIKQINAELKSYEHNLLTLNSAIKSVRPSDKPKIQEKINKVQAYLKVLKEKLSLAVAEYNQLYPKYRAIAGESDAFRTEGLVSYTIAKLGAEKK